MMKGHTKNPAAMEQKDNPKPAASRRATRKKPVRFTLRAAPDSVICVVGTFNSWNPQAHRLERDGDGVYAAKLLLEPGRYEYKFLVNGQWHIDPRCAAQVRNAYGTVNNVLELA